LTLSTSRSLPLLASLAVSAVACFDAGSASAQLRIVDDNIAQNYDIANDPGGLDVIFAAIGAEVKNGFAQPIDVLAVQEANLSGTDATALAAILNGVYGVTTYAAAPVPANVISRGNGGRFGGGSRTDVGVAAPLGMFNLSAAA
jgi:hypothetical protein